MFFLIVSLTPFVIADVAYPYVVGSDALHLLQLSDFMLIFGGKTTFFGREAPF